MVVSYTTNYSPIDRPYQLKDNSISTNADGGGNGGAFMKMFEETESEDAKSSKETAKTDYTHDSIYSNYQASESVIRDYIDNSLLLNTEQVACTNIAQHLALKSSVKDTLYFLNTQAAKSMVNSRKRNYDFQSKPIESTQTVTENNFFKTSPSKNFFLQ